MSTINDMCNSNGYVKAVCDAGVQVGTFASAKATDLGTYVSGKIGDIRAALPEIDLQGTVSDYVVKPFGERVITPLQNVFQQIHFGPAITAIETFAAGYGINHDVITDIKGFNPSAYGVDVTTARAVGVAVAVASTLLAVRALMPKDEKHPVSGRVF